MCLVNNIDCVPQQNREVRLFTWVLNCLSFVVQTSLNVLQLRGKHTGYMSNRQFSPGITA